LSHIEKEHPIAVTKDKAGGPAKLLRQRVVAVRILSESSGIRLAKTRKTVDLQRLKTLDICCRNRKPWKGVA
jgi:hypothetical protein